MRSTLDDDEILTPQSIVLKSGLAGRPGTRPSQGWNQAGLKKKQGKERPSVTWLKTRLQPVDFCFCFY